LKTQINFPIAGLTVLDTCSYSCELFTVPRWIWGCEVGVKLRKNLLLEVQVHIVTIRSPQWENIIKKLAINLSSTTVTVKNISENSISL